MHSRGNGFNHRPQTHWGLKEMHPGLHYKAGLISLHYSGSDFSTYGEKYTDRKLRIWISWHQLWKQDKLAAENKIFIKPLPWKSVTVVKYGIKGSGILEPSC